MLIASCTGGAEEVAPSISPVETTAAVSDGSEVADSTTSSVAPVEAETLEGSCEVIFDTGNIKEDPRFNDLVVRVISTFENSTDTPQWSHVKNNNDGHGITVGLGFTTETGSALEPVEAHVADKPDSKLAPYVPALIDIQQGYADRGWTIADPNSPGNLEGLDGFAEAWIETAESDPDFVDIQLHFVAQRLRAGYDAMTVAGIESPLGLLIAGDTFWHNGEGGLDTIISRVGTDPADNEHKWLNRFLDERGTYVGEIGQPYTTYRVEALRELVESGNFDLNQPISYTSEYDNGATETFELDLVGGCDVAPGDESVISEVLDNEESSDEPYYPEHVGIQAERYRGSGSMAWDSDTSTGQDVNPYMVALPMNEFASTGPVPGAREASPWEDKGQPSLFKGRWVEVIGGSGEAVYAQWLDTFGAPDGSDNDPDYVFGDEYPEVDGRPSIQISDAIADRIGFDGDAINWRFVDAEHVPGGPWSVTITPPDPEW